MEMSQEAFALETRGVHQEPTKRAQRQVGLSRARRVEPGSTIKTREPHRQPAASTAGLENTPLLLPPRLAPDAPLANIQVRMEASNARTAAQGSMLKPSQRHLV
jgi:hypothetical protein